MNIMRNVLYAMASNDRGLAVMVAYVNYKPWLYCGGNFIIKSKKAYILCENEGLHQNNKYI